jgi:senataxin
MGDLVVWSKLFEEAESSLRSARQLASDSISTDTTVFMCTVDALFRVGKTGSKRRILIIDEAGTVPDYKLPLAVSLGVEAVIAVGDQNQLQPFTHTDVSNGFFHRLAETISPSMLEEQFRMHPEISRFVSSSFYDHRLFTNPLTASARCSVPLAGVHWIDYFDTNAESSSRNGAVCNHVELKMLKTFMLEVESRFLMHGKTVMIISFYREQHHLLMRMGESIGLVGSRLEGTKTESYFTNPNFRISTVDASQGSESDVVILSCVRCNAKNQIGFLSHPNRLCVALSRARERLIVLGSSRTLTSKNAIWKGLFNASQVGSSLQEKTSIPFDLEDHVWETL